MIRYWVFALFVTALVSRQQGGLRRAIRTKRPLTQIARGAILAFEVDQVMRTPNGDVGPM